MAKHGIARLRDATEAPARRNPPPHDRWRSDLVTGVLELRLQTLPDRFVSPGTGRFRLFDQEGAGEGAGQVVAHEAAKIAGRPALPGSGIKGAVRTLYEILSDSCDPHQRHGECQANIKQRRFEQRRYCEACSLFGCMGWRGRVSFSDALAAEPDAVEAGVRWVSEAWEPHGEETRGDFRLYDLDAAVVVDKTTGGRSPAPLDIAREGYEGSFLTRLQVSNVSELELGRLLLAMGVAAEEKKGFAIRLGGCKYDGQGAVRVTVSGARLVTPRRRELAGDEARGLWNGWIVAAQTSTWGGEYAGKLRQLADILSTRSA